MTIATWLLTRLGVDDALVGDLLEQRHAGRPRTWLWRQVAGAILSTLARDVTVRPLRSTVAVLLALLLRYLTIRVWRSHESAVDMRTIWPLLDAVSPLGPHAWIVAIGWWHSLVLVPIWFLIGLGLARLSRGAVPVFLAVAVASLLPAMTRQLHGAMTSDISWLLPVLLAIFASSIAAFVVGTLLGAVCGLGERHPIV